MLLSRFKIAGHSMSPSFSEDDNVLVSSLPYLVTKPKINDVVVFEKYNRLYIKRISEVKEGKYFLIGDNKNDSEDSRRFGLVKPDQIRGKVILKI